MNKLLVSGMLAICAAVLGGPNAAAFEECPSNPGALEAFDEDGQPKGMCPLKHTDVQADIAGFIARITLTQEFTNPFDSPIEAVYTFPMSERAAVDSMTMSIGDRVIKGLIKEREEARKIYEKARDEGKAASLLDQERPNIFTQSVANIMPGDTIRITISYVETLVYDGGEYTFAFPMTVGPRYIPGQITPSPDDAIESDVETGLKPGPASTDQVPDSSRITPPITPEGTRAGHDIALTVKLDAGVPLQDIRSDLHEVDIQREGDTKAVVALKNKAEIPNRDFILKYKVAGEKVADAALVHASERGGFVTLILQPPARTAPEEVLPKELLFVIDKSGSMTGFPIEKAKKAMRLCIEQMNPNDTFNLVSFSGGLGECFEKPVPNTEENRKKALDYLANLEGGGGTEMMAAIQKALEGQDDPERLRVVCFMTDGFIGNDLAILEAIQRNAGKARVFAFGIGNSVNRFLIEGMGRVGRGASEVITISGQAEENQADKAAERFHAWTQSPLLADITIEGLTGVQEVYPDPKNLPDLFAGRPIILTGRFAPELSSGPSLPCTVTIKGKTATGAFERTLSFDLPRTAPEHDALASLWARARVEDLMNQDWEGMQSGKPKRDVKEQIIQTGLQFNLVTQYTSFVAVEEKVINKDGKTKTVQVPIEMADGVSYEGVFGEEMMAVKSVRAQGVTKYKSLSATSPQLAPSSLAADSSGVSSSSADTIINSPGEPSPELERKESTKKEEALDAAALAKIDPALRDLSAKVKEGRYEEGAVKVRDGRLDVFIELANWSDEALQQLEQAGVKIKSKNEGGKQVLASIRVEDINALAKLPIIARISPPAY